MYYIQHNYCIPWEPKKTVPLLIEALSAKDGSKNIFNEAIKI